MADRTDEPVNPLTGRRDHLHLYVLVDRGSNTVTRAVWARDVRAALSHWQFATGPECEPSLWEDMNPMSNQAIHDAYEVRTDESNRKIFESDLDKIKHMTSEELTGEATSKFLGSYGIPLQSAQQWYADEQARQEAMEKREEQALEGQELLNPESHLDEEELRMMDEMTQDELDAYLAKKEAAQELRDQELAGNEPAPLDPKDSQDDPDPESGTPPMEGEPSGDEPALETKLKDYDPSKDDDESTS